MSRLASSMLVVVAVLLSSGVRAHGDSEVDQRAQVELDVLRGLLERVPPDRPVARAIARVVLRQPTVEDLAEVKKASSLKPMHPQDVTLRNARLSFAMDYHKALEAGRPLPTWPKPGLPEEDPWPFLTVLVEQKLFDATDRSWMGEPDVSPPSPTNDRESSPATDPRPAPGPIHDFLRAQQASAPDPLDPDARRSPERSASWSERLTWLDWMHGSMSLARDTRGLEDTSHAKSGEIAEQAEATNRLLALLITLLALLTPLGWWAIDRLSASKNT